MHKHTKHILITTGWVLAAGVYAASGYLRYR